MGDRSPTKKGLDDSQFSVSSPSPLKTQPTKKNLDAVVQNTGNGPDCLLVSCSDLVPLFEKGLGFKCEESFLEESAVNAVSRALKKNCAFRFIFVDLDDPTLLLGRFVGSVNKLLEAYPKLRIDIYACSSSSTERILKKCKEVNVTFIAKPITKDKLSQLQRLYK